MWLFSASKSVLRREPPATRRVALGRPVPGHNEGMRRAAAAYDTRCLLRDGQLYSRRTVLNRRRHKAISNRPVPQPRVRREMPGDAANAAPPAPSSPPLPVPYIHGWYGNAALSIGVPTGAAKCMLRRRGTAEPGLVQADRRRPGSPLGTRMTGRRTRARPDSPEPGSRERLRPGRVVARRRGRSRSIAGLAAEPHYKPTRQASMKLLTAQVSDAARATLDP